jgi:hypothetical protein
MYPTGPCQQVYFPSSTAVLDLCRAFQASVACAWQLLANASIGTVAVLSFWTMNQRELALARCGKNPSIPLW